MRGRVAFLLALVLSVGTAVAGQLRDTPRQYLIHKPRKPIVIDGKLDEWDMAGTPYIISPTSDDPLNGFRTSAPTNPLKGDEDLSGRAALAWDEEYLYVAGQMRDDHLMGVKPDSAGNQGPRGWECDSLMVAVASFRQPMKSNSPYSPTPFLGLRYAPKGPDPRGRLVDVRPRDLDKKGMYWILTPGSKWGVAETPTGYNVEAAIPWKDLEFTPRPGERLFVAFLAADVDPEEPLNQLGWGYTGVPKEHPVFRLADREDIAGILTVSADEVPTDQSWAVRWELDALSKAARMVELRVVGQDGEVVARKKVGFDVPVGKTGSAVVEFGAGVVPGAGAYMVEALASAAGGAATVVARVPVRMVEPGARLPVVQNAPGQIAHMPPERVAHHAWDEHSRGFYRHGFVKSKQDYVPYLRRYVEPGLKDAARNFINIKHAWGYTHALHCIAMYRITGDEEYIPLARDIIDYVLDKAYLGWFQATGLIIYRYLTWKDDPDSPFAPPDAEKRYRANLYKIAAEPTDYYFNESGTHNRVWHRYMMLKIARMVAEEDGKPVDPRVIEYTDYHDKLIGEVGDSDDASAGYHWVFFDAAIGIYFHTGDWDAFLAHKGFRKTLARYVEMVSPSGACPQFASCSGWPEVGESMWAYELMSRLTRNGRYRWTSHRIAEYYYNHLDYRANQYHGPYDTARNNFTLAYLLADDSVAPQAPPGGSRITWRHPLVKVPLERLKARPGTSPMEMDSSRWIPDKVVLSGGNDARSLWGLVELLPAAGHGGELPGNLIALMVHDSALLAGQGYYENTPNYQNILWIEDLDGLAADPRPLETEVLVFVDDPAFTFVRVKTERYQHLPVTYTRDIFFYKDGFLAVKDRVKFHTAMKVRVGPCYQTRSLGPQCGENWFNMYYDQLYYTGLGLGGGVQAIRNPAWDALLYFADAPDKYQTVSDSYKENPWRNSPIQVRQVWAGMARAGQEITYAAVLLPHAPTFTPQDLISPPADSEDAPRIELAHNDDGLTVFKAISEMDPVHKFRRETWVMLNQTGQMASAGPIGSDAQVAVVGLDRNGKIAHRALIAGSVLRFRGKDESAAARKHEATPVQMPDYLKD